MYVLIDGHNLIGQLPDISLADPDDEAKLVMLLRGYATSKRGRRLVIVFDRGVYGHPQRLDGYGIECHFARSPQDADTQLIRRLRAIRHPRDWRLVSSDRAIAQVARECGVPVMRAQDFAALLRPPPRSPVSPDEKPIHVKLSPAEVDEWLRLFGEEPQE